MAAAPTRRVLMAAVLAGACGVAANSAHAYQVSPMIFDLEPSGRNSSATLHVENTSALPLTVEITAERRVFDQLGNEARTPAPQDFVLFPPQAVIASGVTQSFRVRYVGEPQLSSSIMYTVTVRQVPVSLPAADANGVRFIFNVSAVVNVVPPQARARVSIQSVEHDGEALLLQLTNDGNKYANIAEAELIISAPGFRHVLTREEWRRSLGVSWLLPGAKRQVRIPAYGAPSTVAASIRSLNGGW